MSERSRPETLLEQLDALQDQVLRDLDSLDERIVALIQQCVQQHGVAPPATITMPAPAEVTKEAA